MEEWSCEAYFETGIILIENMELDNVGWIPPSSFPDFSIRETERSLRSMVISTTIVIHTTTRDYTDETIGPRQYIDFVSLFTKHYSCAVSSLGKMELKLNDDLQKIFDKRDQFNALKNYLEVEIRDLLDKLSSFSANDCQIQDTKKTLEEKDKNNRKIDQLWHQQKIEAKLGKETIEILLPNLKKKIIDTSTAVSSIIENHLTELSSLDNPWTFDLLVLQATYHLVHGDAAPDWRTIRDFIEREDFISTIVLFNNGSISMNLNREMSNEYLDKIDGNFEKIDSVGCRVLIEWVNAQVSAKRNSFYLLNQTFIYFVLN